MVNLHKLNRLYLIQASLLVWSFVQTEAQLILPFLSTTPSVQTQHVPEDVNNLYWSDSNIEEDVMLKTQNILDIINRIRSISDKDRQVKVLDNAPKSFSAKEATPERKPEVEKQYETQPDIEEEPQNEKQLQDDDIDNVSKSKENQLEDNVAFVPAFSSAESQIWSRNNSASLLNQILPWQNAKRNGGMTQEPPLWIGVGAGLLSSLVVLLVIFGMYTVIRKRRYRCSPLQEFSFGTPREEKPIYIKLSQLHRPKKSPNYVVTVLDESNFSIDEEDTSEEELFDMAAIGHRGSKGNFKSPNIQSPSKKDNL